MEFKNDLVQITEKCLIFICYKEKYVIFLILIIVATLTVGQANLALATSVVKKQKFKQNNGYKGKLCKPLTIFHIYFCFT